MALQVARKNLKLLEPVFKKDALAYLFHHKEAVNVIASFPDDFMEGGDLDVIFRVFKELVLSCGAVPEKHEIEDEILTVCKRFNYDDTRIQAILLSLKDIWGRKYTPSRVKNKLSDAIKAHNTYLIAQQIDQYVEDGEYQELVSALDKASKSGMTADDNALPEVMTFAEMDAHPELFTWPEAIIREIVYQGRTTYLTALPKVGKTRLAVCLAADMTNAGLRVLWLRTHSESDPVDLREGFRLAGGDPSLFFVYTGGNPTEGDCRRLVQAYAPDAVVLDTLNSWMNANGIDSENDSKAQGFLMVWNEIAKVYGVGVLMLGHNNKQDSYRGSTGIAGAVDIIINMTRPTRGSQDIRKFDRVGRGIPSHSWRMSFDGERYAFLESFDQDPDVSLRYRVSQAIRRAPGITTNQLVGDVGKRRTDVLRVRDSLLEAGRIRVESDGQAQRHYPENGKNLEGSENGGNQLGTGSGTGCAESPVPGENTTGNKTEPVAEPVRELVSPHVKTVPVPGTLMCRTGTGRESVEPEPEREDEFEGESSSPPEDDSSLDEWWNYQPGDMDSLKNEKIRKALEREKLYQDPN